MADTFGLAQNGRAQVGGRFYATPAAAVDANVIYMPKYSASPYRNTPASYPLITSRGIPLFIDI